MLNNSIQNIFLQDDKDFCYLLPLIDKICQLSGLEIVKSDKIEFLSNNLFVGTKNVDDVEKIALKAIENKIENAIVVSGDSFPFVTPFGQTFVAEAWKNKVFKYSLDAKSFGIKEAKGSDIILKDDVNFDLKIKDIKYQTVIINAAFALYISKKAKSIQDGIELAQKIVQSNDLK